MDALIQAPKGTARKVVPLEQVQVPNLWYVATYLDDQAKHDVADYPQMQAELRRASKAVLETWHLCHDLLEYAKGNPDYHA